MTVIYYLASMYYRRTSVETKRIDSLMRSILYASFSGKPELFIPWNELLVDDYLETLMGLFTIRAYREQVRE